MTLYETCKRCVEFMHFASLTVKVVKTFRQFLQLQVCTVGEYKLCRTAGSFASCLHLLDTQGEMTVKHKEIKFYLVFGIKMEAFRALSFHNRYQQPLIKYKCCKNYNPLICSRLPNKKIGKLAPFPPSALFM